MDPIEQAEKIIDDTYIRYKTIFENTGTATILIEEENDGTLVTWSHRGTLGRTPLMRWLMLIFANGEALEEDFIDALQGLEAHLLLD